MPTGDVQWAGFQVLARRGIPEAPEGSGVLTASTWLTPMRLRSKATAEAAM
jgi:hypothetical protein